MSEVGHDPVKCPRGECSGDDVVCQLRLIAASAEHDEECATWENWPDEVDPATCDCTNALIRRGADEIERLRAGSWSVLAAGGGSQ